MSAARGESGRIVLFEDDRAAVLGPLVLGRPIFELVLGATSLRCRIERGLGRPATAARVRPHLAALLPELGLEAAPAGGDDLWVNAALGADPGTIWPEVGGLKPGEALRSAGGRWLAVRPRPGEGPDRVLHTGDAEAAPLGYAVRTVSRARILGHAWELLGWHEEALLADTAGLGGQAGAGLPASAQGAEIEAPVSLDCSRGPVVVRPGARVAAFSRLEGPVWIERDAQILGGRVAGSYIGPGCRVRGEVEASVLLGWSNKAHDGFLGHSYVGSWVNLGALTTTSDLKNNYGEVRMCEEEEMRATGLIKAGSVLSDHVKTAIGTLLAAGTVIGLGANLFGCTGTAPTWVPAFAWGVGPRARSYDLERFLATATQVRARRNQTLTAAQKAALIGAFAISRNEREGWLALQAASGAAGRNHDA